MRIFRRNIYLFLMMVFAASVASATPAQFILIRHGEKGDSGRGLSPQGWLRAQGLPQMFRTRPEFLQFGLPAGLYAMSPNGADMFQPEGKSLRAIQTLQYVSQDLGIATNANYTRDDYQSMLQRIMADSSLDGKMVVICWEHTVLREIAAAIGVPAPPKYKSSSFDRAWVITMDPAGGAPTFRNLPERVLPGDDQE